MMIEKNGKVFAVRECKEHWTLLREDGALTVQYEIPKELCKTVDELETYVRMTEL